MDRTEAYSRRVWGAAQARTYIAKIVADIKSLIHGALHHPQMEGVYPGLRRKRSEMHHIYYLATDSSVTIVAIMHVQRDPGALLNTERFAQDSDIE